MERKKHVFEELEVIENAWRAPLKKNQRLRDDFHYLLDVIDVLADVAAEGRSRYGKLAGSNTIIKDAEKWVEDRLDKGMLDKK